MMVIALLVSVASPASAAVASTFKDSAYQAHYVALGDAATEGIGLDNPETDSYIVKIAEKNGWGDDYWAYAKKSLRVEELRYLLDSEYTGDGYTAAMGSFLRRDRATVQGYVSNAEVITINAGVNNFSTYIVEQMVYYLENNGATKYSYSFDEFAGADVAEAMENVKAAVMDNFYAAADQNGDEALDLINYVAEVSTYAVLSYVTSFNGMVSSIYELNSDVDLYVIGIYNPAQGEKLTYEIGGRTINVPIGDFFGALVEIANAYSQILAPRAYDYTYVDPGNPELLIDQMGNTNLTDDERIPNGLMIELLALTEGAAVNEVVDLFADYGITKTENEALMFLEDLLSCNSDEERTQFIMDTLNEYVVDAVYDEFVNQLASYLGQFGNGEDVLSEQEIKDLLADLDAAADEAARELVAGAFVDGLLTTPELLNQAAAQVIYEYIESYGLSGYVTVDNVVTLLEDMADCAENEREGIVTAWVHKLAVAKITAYVQNIVGEDYTEAMADQMLTDMKVPGADPTAVAKEALWNDVFAEYLSEKIEDKFGEQGLQLINYGSFDAFVAAIYAAGDNYDVVVRETIRASGAAKVSEAAFGVYTTDEIIALFAGMDAKATDAEKKAYLNQQLGYLASLLSDSFWTAYNAYVSATNTTINLIGQYLDGVATAAEALAEYIAIQNDIVIQILEVYAENFDSNSGSLDLSGFADFQQLRGDAISKILSGYDDYRDAVDSAMKSADTFGEYMDPVYELLLSLAEVDTISLNDLLSVAQKITTNGQSYVVDMVDNLMVGKDLGEDEKTAAYLALRYYLAGAMMIMPSANGHATIANRVTAAINGENMNSTVGNLANMVINGGLDLYHCAKEFLALPTTGSGQAGTLINPDVYVALGDDITLGTAIDGADTYVKLLADALAMEYHDTANYDNDMILNHAIGGIRTEELLALLDPNYNGDAYTDARYGEDYIEAKREQIIANIMTADLITIEVGINNLVTYPLTQALLAYNGEDTYEMDWTRYFAQSRVDKVSEGKDAVTKLILGIVDKAENRVPSLEGVSAYDKCETALNTISTAVEALAYGVLGYIVNLDAAVETVAEMNDDATIVLVGFYNPLEDTYVKLQRSISVGGKDIELPQREINVSAIADKLINVSNRFLTNYVGNIAGDGTASDEGSRIVTVDIKDAELCISDTGASKNLAIMESWRTVSVKGYDIDILVPEYFLETGRTAGEALHPNAAGHEYIFQQILAALKYEIHADVNPEYNWKYYGEDDPGLYYSIDDESSLYDMIVELEREPGEDVGFYDITATVVNNGYYEVDVYVGTFEIKARPVIVTVKDVTTTVGNEPVFEATVTDSLTDEPIEGLDVVFSVNPDHNDYSTVGTYTISASLENPNYVVAEVTTGTLTIKSEMAIGTIKWKANSLNLVDEVHYNFDYTLSGFNMNQVVEIGLLKFYDKTEDVNDSTYKLAEEAGEIYVWDNTYNENNGAYRSRTAGIPAAELGQDAWYRVYVKLEDGTIVYSTRIVYSAVRYSKTVLGGEYNYKLKQLCVSLMNYGAAAQIYFAEKGIYELKENEELMNSFLTVEQRGSIKGYSDSMIDERLPSNTDVYGEFGNNSGLIKSGNMNLTLLGAISLNIKDYTYSKECVTESGFVYWNHDTFAACDAPTGKVLTWENAGEDGKVTFTGSAVDGTLEMSITGIAAAEMDRTFVVVPYVVIDNEYHFGAITRCSVDYYASVIIARSSGSTMANLAEAMVVYGEYANAYFNGKEVK